MKAGWEALDPFAGAMPDEIPLPSAPLELVVTQLRYPVIASVARADFIGPFQEALRSLYPIMRDERELGIQVTNEGMRAADSGRVWRFTDQDGSWRISLAPSFLALDTKQYTSRTEFFTRLEEILTAFGDSIGTAVYDRFGVRYVNRLEGVSLTNDLPPMVRPEVLGLTALGFAESSSLSHSVTETRLAVDEALLQVRTGWLPAGETLDPTIDPAPGASWLLDMDMYEQGVKVFEPNEVVGRGRGFAEQIYRFFRWAVTDQFLRYAGGAVVPSAK